MDFSLTYSLEGAGWAMARIQDGENKVDVTVSYLHDTLRELGEAACAMRDEADAARVVFMDEPGEVQLLLARHNDVLDYELRWFDDWNSWGMHPNDKFQTIFRGSTSVARFCDEVRNEFEALVADHGEDGYKQKWVEHDFPTDLLRLLRSQTNAEQAVGGNRQERP